MFEKQKIDPELSAVVETSMMFKLFQSACFLLRSIRNVDY